MNDEPTTLHVPSPPSRGTSAVVVLVAALVGLAILKPWALGPAATEARATAEVSGGITIAPAEPRSTPGPSPSEAIWDPNAMACMSSEGNRLLALLRAPGLEVRTWLVLDDVAVADPLDPAAIPLRLPSSHVIGLGVCAQRIDQAASAPSAAEIVDVETVAAAGTPTLTDLGAPRVITRQLGDPSLGVLYGPPASRVAPGPSSMLTPPPSPGPPPADASWPIWPIGDYALGFRFVGDSPAVVRWVRLEILPAAGKYD